MRSERSWTTWLRLGLSIAAFFVAWELVGQSERFVAIKPVTMVMPELWDALVEGDLIAATIGTLQVAATGYVLAAVVGIALGYVTGSSPVIASALDPLINAAYATPIYMIIPLLGIYTGLEFTGKVFLVVLFCIFVITINTSAGVRQVPAALIETGQAFRLTRLQQVWRIILPSASPYVITGLRLAVGLAIQGAIVGELLLRVDNMGLLLINAGAGFEIPRLLALTFFVALLATSTMLMARWAESRVLRWKR